MGDEGDDGDNDGGGDNVGDVGGSAGGGCNNHAWCRMLATMELRAPCCRIAIVIINPTASI